MADRVKFNIHNVHYAVAKNGGGWDAPVAIPGAVSFSLEPQGDVSPFYADGMVYYNAVANNGYSGDLEMAMFPKDFRTHRYICLTYQASLPVRSTAVSLKAD